MSGRSPKTLLDDEERRDWLRLARAENVGPVAFRYLIETYGEPARAIGALPRMAERAGRARPEISRLRRGKSRAWAR